MSVINDDGEHLSSVIDLVCFFDESLLAADITALCVDLKGIAEDAQRARIGV